MACLFLLYNVLLITVVGMYLESDVPNLNILDTSDSSFKSYIQRFNKIYVNDDEYKLRYNTFKTNLEYINTFNQQSDSNMNKYSLKLGLGPYTDLSSDEYNQLRHRLYLNIKSSEHQENSHLNVPIIQSDLPSSWDWRDYGAVSSVKDQSMCGSCWAFSTVGAIEGIYAITTKNLFSFSPQQLVDCSQTYGNLGCDGGYPIWALNYLANNTLLETDTSYPYAGVDQTCAYERIKGVVKVSKYANVTNITYISELAVQQAVLQQPLSICIDASQPTFQHYQSGIYYDSSCSSEFLDHAVLLVGYGSINNTDYWIVKNSWSSDWGMNGYILMSRNRDNNCGVATFAVYPEIEALVS